VIHTEEPRRYELRVKGQLADRWAAWFDGMTLTPQADGTTVLHGMVADQSALHGLLNKVSDLGLELISVTRTPATQTTAGTATSAAAEPAPTTDQTGRRSTP
jgi:hypothetical protein